MDERKQTELSPPPVGGASLLVVFAVLCLTVFALLSLSTVRANGRLSETSARAVADYYAADVKAQEILARLDKTEQGRLPELFPRFSRVVEEIKYFNGKSMAFAKEGLQMTGMKDGPAAPYTPAGRTRPEGAQGASLFEAKI